MASSQRLPRLRRDHDHERTALSRLMRSHEISLEGHLARVLAQAGRHAAQQHGAADVGHDLQAQLERTLYRALRPALIATAQAFSHRLRSSPKAAHAWQTKAFEDLDQAIARHIAEHAAEAVVDISRSTAEAIARVVSRAVAENLGQEETARLIVEATSGEIAMARARRIARTEIHFAAMYGQQAAAEASPLAFEKVWLSTEDHRTRYGHAKANGQRRPLNEEFEVLTATTAERDNGQVEHLQYPGDTSASPGMIINCRCVCMYEPLPYLKPQGDQAPAEPSTSPPRPDVPQSPDVTIDEPTDLPTEDPAPVTERDLEARPYERQAVTVYASGNVLSLDKDGTPRTGAMVHLVGPNDLYFSPDANEVDRDIAANAGGLLSLRRPVLWQIEIPAGPAFPPGLIEFGGAGISINSGVGRFGLVPLKVRAVRKERWGQVAPKPNVELDAEQIDLIQRVIDAVDVMRDAREMQYALFGVFPTLPDSVRATLTDTRWTKPSLARYLERLIAGSIQDEPGTGEPDTQARVIVVDAVADLAAAVPEGFQE